MSPRRRLTGIAAMSAVTLATAGIGGASAADEPEGLDELRALIEAFAGEELPEEALEQMLTTYQAMGVDPSMIFGGLDPQALAALVGPDGDLDESAFLELLFSAPGDSSEVFLKLEGLAFPKVEDDAFPKLEDQAFPKVELEAFPKLEDQAFPKLEDSIDAVEVALAAAAAQGDIDPDTLAAILELLPED